MLPQRTPKEIVITQDQVEEMRTDVAKRAPQEACGLLAGRIDGERFLTVEIIPMLNALHSPFRYRLDPLEQIKAFERIEAAGLELIGIYHSHPEGPDSPSATDLAEAYYPEVVYLIWSRVRGQWKCRGFSIHSHKSNPADIIVTTNV